MTSTENRKVVALPVITCLLSAWLLGVFSSTVVAIEKDGDDLATPVTIVKSKAKVPTDPAIAKAIRHLDSDRFMDREAAVETLLKLGKPAISQLTEAATGGSAEVSWRAIFVLKEMALRLDFEELDAAEKALRKLAASDNDIAKQRAFKIIASLEEQRGKRAIEAVNKLGGKILVEGYLKLDSDWKGGDAGLGYIARLQGMERVSIESGAGVSEAAVVKLRAQMPGVPIHRFGKAFLGVGGDFDINGMIVTSVVPESGAAKAGIEANDVITRIDGKKVGNFDALVKVISSKNAGDEVVIQYYRHATGEIIKAKTKLTSRPGVEVEGNNKKDE